MGGVTIVCIHDPPQCVSLDDVNDMTKISQHSSSQFVSVIAFSKKSHGYLNIAQSVNIIQLSNPVNWHTFTILDHLTPCVNITLSRPVNWNAFTILIICGTSWM